MNNEEKDTDKLKATKETVEYYKKRMQTDTFFTYILVFLMVVVGVVFLITMPEIWWISFFPFSLAVFGFLLDFFCGRQINKEIKAMDSELAEAEKALNQQNTDIDQ